MILNAIGDSLHISKADTWASWEVLRRFGNMSSATLGFVLQEIRRETIEDQSRSSTSVPATTKASRYLPPSSLNVDRRYAVKRWIPTIAFGPASTKLPRALEAANRATY